ncbi:hypothetical protein [uncultured Microbacterium sp.]|uniref:hypothetical protein n=1 Tax=uncultured Microbacterium sp. TaxID=191216 RepID=UPI0025DEC1BC|nr:hypothetical protein [uncultured Microbacterium sp.]
MSSTAHDAWVKAKGSPARGAYIAGYEQGAFEERLRVTAFLAENMATIAEFAGDRAPALLKYMFREMTPPDRTIGASDE